MSLLIIIFFSMLNIIQSILRGIIFMSDFWIKPFNYHIIKLLNYFILSLLFLFVLFFQQISELSIFKRTLNMFNESDSSLEIRGYKVFFESNSLQALFGMGNDKYIYDPQIVIHSTFFMILTSFGVIDFLIFSSLIVFWILDISKSIEFRFLICVCALLYYMD